MSEAPAPAVDLNYRLEDRYLKQSGSVFLTGTQALVRIVVEQAQRDRAAGLDTAGFISGYRGSPLGGVDLELWRAKKLLAENRIEFLPAVNEDLAATAVLGSQQVESHPDRRVQGVFGLWYGKGPGVDRAGDALKHGNAYGSSPHGGVLVVAGDDHGCVSSSMPHQSDAAFLAWFIPTLNPASIAEYSSFGQYGYALSRYSGMWVGFKAISETVEAAASVPLTPSRRFLPPDFTPPPSGLHYRWPDLPGPQIEARIEAKKQAVLAFADTNPIDRHIYQVADAAYGIVTTGKAHLDLMEALRLLGLDEAECRRIGIDIYKVGMVWPLARRDALDFVKEKHEVLVIEEKRGIIESQFKEYFYDHPGHKPRAMVGKSDENGAPLVPWIGELSPRLLVPIVAQRLDAMFPGLSLARRAAALAPKPERVIEIAGVSRTPYFCSGCPHNTSTKVPEGSKAMGGIGCHGMVTWMDRETSSLTQMGGEGANWVASSLFTGKGHIFQNLGEGTYYHSGSMAIRQAIAAKANVTYKILYNDAVAMTGGQPVDGPISVQAIAHTVRAEGVTRIALASDDPGKFQPQDFPEGVTIHDRRDLDPLQRELRAVPGVSVLIYEQACATEKRRRRKRGTVEDPKRFAFINALVCEGCGDCSVESNCLSVEPRETPFGRKRKINLSTCNKDFSCLNGFCPSFVTVEGATRRRHASGVGSAIRAESLPLPPSINLDVPYDLLVTGVGGTGVITVGAVVAMAAHLEGKGASVLHFTGFAQKFGPVLSYIRLAKTPDLINQVRIDQGAADALIGCDLVVSSSPKASSAYRRGMKAIVNSAEMPTGDIVRNGDADLAVAPRLAAIAQAVGEDNFATFDANAMAEELFGDAVFANTILLGFAWQNGLVPISLEAVLRAIELNEVAIDQNKEAFAAGRLAAAIPDFIALTPQHPPPGTLDDIVARHAAFLSAYQNDAWAARYRATIKRVRGAAELKHGGDRLTEAIARSLFKLMSYKDEYEVARLHMQTGFLDELKQTFDGDFKINYHLAPPLLPSGVDARGRPRKRQFGQWIQVPLRGLARMKFLRGTPFDPFGYSEERRVERRLIGWYEKLIDSMIARFPSEPVELLLAVATAPMEIRGFGPVKAASVKAAQTRVAQLLEPSRLLFQARTGHESGSSVKIVEHL
jgi:indolepyruvate ferredoxin oxidoreductase